MSKVVKRTLHRLLQVQRSITLTYENISSVTEKTHAIVVRGFLHDGQEAAQIKGLYFSTTLDGYFAYLPSATTSGITIMSEVHFDRPVALIRLDIVELKPTLESDKFVSNAKVKVLTSLHSRYHANNEIRVGTFEAYGKEVEF